MNKQEVIDFKASPRSRFGDWETSHEGARDVAIRAGSQRHRLLATYAGLNGLTDEEAAQLSDLERVCYWKRCGELRENGYIEEVYNERGPVTRPGRAGVQRIVCSITDKGRKALKETE